MFWSLKFGSSSFWFGNNKISLTEINLGNTFSRSNLTWQCFGSRVYVPYRKCPPYRTMASPLTLFHPYLLHVQEELPLQDTGASAPPGGAQRLCLQPHQKQYGRRTAPQSGPHGHPQPSTPNIQVVGHRVNVAARAGFQSSSFVSNRVILNKSWIYFPLWCFYKRASL